MTPLRPAAAALLAAALLAACAHAPGGDLGPEAVRARYDAGFAEIVRAASAHPDPEVSERIRFVAALRSRHMGWATHRGTEYTPMPGEQADAWFAAVPPGHPALQEMGSVLEQDHAAAVPVVRIRPEPIDRRWAGVFLVHEIALLVDRVMGLAPYPSEERRRQSQLRAYLLTYRALRAAGGPAFDSALDALLDEVRAASLQELRGQLPTALPPHLPRLAELVGPGAPGSRFEEERRARTLAAAALIRHAERHGLPDLDLVDEVEAVVAG